MIYLSIPYTGREYVSFRVSCVVAAKLIEAGNVVMAPIVYGHMLVDKNYMPKYDCDFWLKHDLEILCRCSMVAVIKLDGWEESVGVKAETAEARRLGIPVIYLDPTWFVSRELIEVWSSMALEGKDFGLAEVTE